MVDQNENDQRAPENDEGQGGNQGGPTSLREFFNRATTRKIVAHILLALVLITLIVGSSHIFSWRAEKKGVEWITNLKPGRVEPSKENPNPPPPTLVLAKCIGIENDEEKARLQGQLNDIRNRAKYHLDVTLFIFSNFYMSIMAFSIAGGIAAITLAVISKRGVDQASEYLITTFLVMMALAIFYQSFPGVFQQRQNIDNNRALYIKYVNLEDDIVTYCATGEMAIRAPMFITAARTPANDTEDPREDSKMEVEPFTAPISGKQFIHYINHQLKTYNDISVGMDESKAAAYAKEQFQTQ
jgi:hypothetical protein